MRDAFALSAADVDAIAARVVELLREEPRVGRHVDTTAVATMLGVSGDWVREHAAELGAVRLGDGPKGALRFDLRRVKAAWIIVASSGLAARASVGPVRRGAFSA